MGYVLGPVKADDDYWPDRYPVINSFEVDARKEFDTGLVTPNGQKIFRVQPPVGFGRDEEW